MTQKKHTRKANAKANQQGNGRKPDLYAWHVPDRKDAFWTRIGAAWAHKDGQGFTVQLDSVPVQGQIVLRAKPSKAQDEAQTDDEGGGA